MLVYINPTSSSSVRVCITGVTLCLRMLFTPTGKAAGNSGNKFDCIAESSLNIFEMPWLKRRPYKKSLIINENTDPIEPNPAHQSLGHSLVRKAHTVLQVEASWRTVFLEYIRSGLNKRYGESRIGNRQASEATL